MKEYKRHKKDLEEQVSDLHKKSQYHDEHLRICDAWFAQMLDEVRVLASETLPTPPPSASSHSGLQTPSRHVRRISAENEYRRGNVQVGLTI